MLTSEWLVICLVSGQQAQQAASMTDQERKAFAGHRRRLCRRLHQAITKLIVAFKRRRTSGLHYAQLLLALLRFNASLQNIFHDVMEIMETFGMKQEYLGLNPVPMCWTASLTLLSDLTPNDQRRRVVRVVDTAIRRTLNEAMWHVMVTSSVAREFVRRHPNDSEEKQLFQRRLRGIQRLSKTIVDSLSDKMTSYGTGYVNTDALMASIADIQSIAGEVRRLAHGVTCFMERFGLPMMDQEPTEGPLDEHEATACNTTSSSR